MYHPFNTTSAPPSAIDAFLNRKLDSHDWLKSVSEQALDKELAGLNPPYKFHTKPFAHQKACFWLGLHYDNLMLLCDLGTGKTRTALDIIAYRIQIGQIKKALIVVPNIPIIEGWIKECAKHTPHLKAIALYGTKNKRLKLLNSDADLYIINYAGLQSILSTGGRKRIVPPNTVDEFAKDFQCVVFDEIAAVKNPRSLTFKICDRLGYTIPYRYGLSGRPFGRQPLDLWAEFKVIDGGDTLGRTIFLFRSTYFRATQTPWKTEWKLKARLQDHLAQTIKHRSIRYRTDECLSLPKVFRITKTAPIPPEMVSIYTKTGRTFINSQTYETARSCFVQLREITSGFLNFKTNEGMEEHIIFETQPKLELLESLLTEVPEDAKAIIFHEFTFSGNQISKRLDELQTPHRWIYGGTSDKNKLKYLNDFYSDPEVRFLITNSASGGVGLNLQHANYVFFYECPVSPMIRHQAEGRVFRSGQTKTVYVYDIVMSGTVDEKILQFIEEGKDLMQALVERRTEEVLGINAA